MRYDDKDRESTNVEDRRGDGGGGGGGGLGGMPIQIGGGGFSLTTMLIVGALMLFFGINPLEILGGGGPGGVDMSRVPGMPRMGQERTGPRQTGEIPGLPGHGPAAPAGGRDEMKSFVAKVFADTEDVWTKVLPTAGAKYRLPKLIIFEGGTQTACGPGQTAMGPFYCPMDEKIYIDLAFYDELRRRFKAPGDFAQAYVIAHEVGHHIQKILGIADGVQQLKERSPRAANAIQVRMELQADCLAGVWAALNNKMKNRLQPGDIEEGLNAASQIGDDMITQGRLSPDRFTHGSSAQRQFWFKRGVETGDLERCDTFKEQQP
jgi:uncharacterized protein